MRLIHTQGRGLEAEVEIASQRLFVLDALSPVEAPLQPGKLSGSALEVVAIEGLTRLITAPAETTLGFEREHGWRYRATGQIVTREPFAVDFGALRVELALTPRDDWQSGERLAVAIDQIRLVKQGADG